MNTSTILAVRVLFHSEDFVGVANSRGAGDGWLDDFGGAPLTAPFTRGDHEGTVRAAPPVPVAAAAALPALASALDAGRASLGATQLSDAV